MANVEKLPRQEWIERCALEIGVLIPAQLQNYIEELSPAFVVD